MELLAYGAILKRRLWIIIFMVGVVSIYVGYQYYHLDKTPGAFRAYQSSVTIRIGLQSVAHPVSTNSADDLSTSDQLADAFVNSQLINSREFAAQVSAQVQADMNQVASSNGANPNLSNVENLSAISSALSALRVHNLITINAVWGTPDGARAIANAAAEVCTKNIGTYVDYVVRGKSALPESSAPPKMAAELVAGPTTPGTASGPSSNKLQLLIALIFVALVIGVILAFLIEYVDDRIYSREVAQELLHLPFYGEVPRATLSSRRGARQR